MGQWCWLKFQTAEWRVILGTAPQTCLAPQPLQAAVFRAGMGITADGVWEYLG